MFQQPNPPIPDAWVNRIFDRMTAVYGSQKIGAMWLDADRGQVMQAWGAALARYPQNAIAAALLELPERPSPWPPTLPEFVALTREAAEQAMYQPLQLLGPGETLADPDSPIVKNAIAELRAFIARRRMPLA